MLYDLKKYYPKVFEVLCMTHDENIRRVVVHNVTARDGGGHLP